MFQQLLDLGLTIFVYSLRMRRILTGERMKTRTKNFFSLQTLVVCFCLIRTDAARAQLGNYDGFDWQKFGNTATIEGYDGTNNALIVPGTIPYGGTNLPVTTIGSDAFPGKNMTSITIPDSVTDIGSFAFSSCLSLTNVVLGAGVVTIDSYAFSYCRELAGINIPNGVTSIGDSVFQGCGGLTSISFPDAVTSIGDSAFFYCGLSSLNIPDTVTNIGSMAFLGCAETNVITIGSGVTSIGFAAFNDCFRLSGFIVDPENSFYSSLGGVLFDKNQNVLIQFPGGIGGSYTIPDAVTNIGPGAFSYAANLTNVFIPDSVTSIDTNAFFYCLGLTSISIPDSVTKIEAQAFIYCWNLASVTVGSDVTSIGDDAFNECGDLQSIYFRGNSPVADSSVIAYDTGVTAYYLPGTTNWSVFSMDTGIPATLWLPQIQTGASGSGIQTNVFSFNINWTSGQTVTIEGCTNLFSPDWQLLQTNTLTGSALYFSDPQSTNFPTRFYRVISP